MVAQSQGNEESRLVDTASQVTNHDIPSVAVNVGETPFIKLNGEPLPPTPKL